MNGLDIDGTLPGQEVEEEEDLEETIRRENEFESSTSDSSLVDTWTSESSLNEESLRGWLYLVAGAGYGLLVVYLLLVIYMDMKLPILSDDGITDTNGALTTAILISAMVYVTIWFFMSGKKHSFFTDDPDKAKFYAGIIGLASLVIIALSWEEHSREMIVSAILTSVSTWSYIRSSEMKD
jgi:hypothetical protein